MADLSHLPDWPARMAAEYAAAYLGISPAKLRYGVKEGRYPAPIRDGSRVLWHRADIDAYLAQERGDVDLSRRSASNARPKKRMGTARCGSQ